MQHRAFTFPTILLTVAVLGSVPADAAASCEDLAQLSLSTTTVTFAGVVPVGAFAPASVPGRDSAAQPRPFPNLQSFCRVMLTAKPTRDSEIKLEVWLPEAGWNGRFQAVTAGGLAGSVPYTLMAPAMARGYATAGTDTGHVGNNADFMPGQPREADRLRVPLDARDGGSREGCRGCLLRQRADMVVLQTRAQGEADRRWRAPSGTLTTFTASWRARRHGTRRVWTRGALGSTSRSIERQQVGFLPASIQ